MPHRQVSTMHSIKTLTVSRERQNPASSMVKPTCMPNTRKAAIRVQTVLIGLTMSEALTVVSAAKTLVPSKPEVNATTSKTSPKPTALPQHNSFPYRRHSGSRSLKLRRDNLLRRDSFVPRLERGPIDTTPLVRRYTP